MSWGDGELFDKCLKKYKKNKKFDEKVWKTYYNRTVKHNANIDWECFINDVKSLFYKRR